jgi:molybdopterin molybdotransferase
MLTIAEALDAVLQHSGALPPVSCPVDGALGCVLAEDIVADADSPPFDKSIVDGYAVRSTDLTGAKRSLRVGEAIMAGQTPSRPLQAREAALVMTGAPIPPGCDAVVMHERTRASDGEVVIDEPVVRTGQNVLRRGREMRAGAVVVVRGAILSPARLGVLSAVGRTEVQVVPRPRVAIVATGDELVEPGQNPGPGQIRNSNGVILQALVMQSGAVADTLPIAPDQPERLREIFGRGLDADLLVISGGVSAGQRDLVPGALESLGVSRVFHKVRLKPGKPLWFGIGPARGARPGALVFGLPGNPVSGLVGFLVFVKPSLAVLSGKGPPRPELQEARLVIGFHQRGDRTTYYPARVVGSSVGTPGVLSVETLDWSGSADLCTVAQADGFAVFPGGDRDYAPGEIVAYLPTR